MRWRTQTFSRRPGASPTASRWSPERRAASRETALLRARGARVVVSDVSEGVHALACDDIATLTGDVAEEATATRTVTLALERFGRLDVLVNNAGRTLNKALTFVASSMATRLISLRNQTGGAAGWQGAVRNRAKMVR